jgi:hypothetical protein
MIFKRAVAKLRAQDWMAKWGKDVLRLINEGAR